MKNKQTKSLFNNRALETKAIKASSTFEVKKGVFFDKVQNLHSPDDILKTFFKTSKSKIAPEELKKKLGEVLLAFELNTHFALWHTTSEIFQTLIVEFCTQIIKEYACKTASEKALAEIMAGAFVRQLRCAERLEDSIGGEFLSSEEVALLSALGKELDRATRTYLTALFTLRQIKSSPISLNIKATTSFIAQNQQINVSGNRDNHQNENIKLK